MNFSFSIFVSFFSSDTLLHVACTNNVNNIYHLFKTTRREYKKWKQNKKENLTQYSIFTFKIILAERLLFQCHWFLPGIDFPNSKYSRTDGLKKFVGISGKSFSWLPLSSLSKSWCGSGSKCTGSGARTLLARLLRVDSRQSKRNCL